jgi:hypothetical protein
VRDELLRRWTEDGLESEERAISRARWSQLEKALAKARKEKKVRAWHKISCPVLFTKKSLILTHDK